jgi:hypothetical protein
MGDACGLGDVEVLKRMVFDLCVSSDYSRNITDCGVLYCRERKIDRSDFPGSQRCGRESGLL